MFRSRYLIAAVMMLAAFAAHAADRAPLSGEVLDAAREVGYRLPAVVPGDILARAASSRTAQAAPRDQAPWPTDHWTESTPEDQGMSTPLLTTAFAYAFNHGSRAVTVIRNGYLVAEHYGHGWDAATRQQAFSVSKSFTSCLLGMLMDDGVIAGVEEPAADFIPRWDDPQHGAVTIGHLLSMDSGLQYNLLTDPLLIASRNQNKYAVGLPMEHAPGTKWVYHNAACQVPSEIILNATGRQTAGFAAQRLAAVIGMPTTTWDSDRAGNTLTYMGIVAPARELAKFGYLFLRQGQWDGQQVVSAAYVARATQPSQALNPFYGYLWWLNTAGLAMPDVPADAYAAMGFEEKRIYVVPSLDLVAVRLGEPNRSWDDNAFLGRVCAAVTGPQVDAEAKAGSAGTRGDEPVLRGAYPNPFNPRTEIAFSLPADTGVELAVYDMRGRLVRTLLQGQTLTAGEHRLVWDGRDRNGSAAVAGIYFARLEAGGRVLTSRMTLAP